MSARWGTLHGFYTHPDLHVFKNYDFPHFVIFYIFIDYYLLAPNSILSTTFRKTLDLSITNTQHDGCDTNVRT
jgi:hypothetical protein